MNEALQVVVDLTHRVSALAEQGEWAEAARLDGERQMRLRAFCAGLEPQSTAPQTIAALTQVLELNDALIGAVQHSQRALVREADTVRVGRQAVAAYHSAP